MLAKLAACYLASPLKGMKGRCEFSAARHRAPFVVLDSVDAAATRRDVMNHRARPTPAIDDAALPKGQGLAAIAGEASAQERARETAG